MKERFNENGVYTIEAGHNGKLFAAIRKKVTEGFLRKLRLSAVFGIKMAANSKQTIQSEKFLVEHYVNAPYNALAKLKRKLSDGF